MAFRPFHAGRCRCDNRRIFAVEGYRGFDRAATGERICAMLEGRVGFLLRMSPLTPVPIGIDYDTPHTLGTDRIAAAVGAVEVYGAGDMLIVDMGTAITFDFVEGGVFRGGNISLGVRFAFSGVARLYGAPAAMRHHRD